MDVGRWGRALIDQSTGDSLQKMNNSFKLALMVNSSKGTSLPSFTPSLFIDVSVCFFFKHVRNLLR